MVEVNFFAELPKVQRIFKQLKEAGLRPKNVEIMLDGSGYIAMVEAYGTTVGISIPRDADPVQKVKAFLDVQ